MTAVAVVAHHEREAAAAGSPGRRRLARRARPRGWVVPDDAVALGLDDLVSERPLEPGRPRRLASAATARCCAPCGLLDGAPVPLLGVNVGVLGYLTEIEPPELTAALERFLAGPEQGRWHLDERMMLHVSRRSASGGGAWRALNEAVVEKHESGHTVRLLARIAGELVHELRGRRPDRGHAHRLDGLLAVGARPDRVAEPPGAAADAGVAAHAVRPHARARPDRDGGDRGGRASARPSSRSTARSSRRLPRATSCPAVRPTRRPGSCGSRRTTSTRS